MSSANRFMGDIVDLRPLDVVCGRGDQNVSRDGNARFYKVIDRYKVQYMAAKTRHEKTIIIGRIISGVSPGRFIKKHDTLEGAYVALQEKEIRQKICHAVRYRTKNRTEGLPPPTERPPDPVSADTVAASRTQKQGSSTATAAAIRQLNAATPQAQAFVGSHVGTAKVPAAAARLHNVVGYTGQRGPEHVPNRFSFPQDMVTLQNAAWMGMPQQQQPQPQQPANPSSPQQQGLSRFSFQTFHPTQESLVAQGMMMSNNGMELGHRQNPSSLSLVPLVEASSSHASTSVDQRDKTDLSNMQERAEPIRSDFAASTAHQVTSQAGRTETTSSNNESSPQWLSNTTVSRPGSPLFSGEDLNSVLGRPEEYH